MTHKTRSTGRTWDILYICT